MQFGNQFVEEEYYEEEPVSLYKTEMCKNWVSKGCCRYGKKCQFAHGEDELVKKDPIIYKYKQKECVSFHMRGFCPYGIRCLFVHEIRSFPQIHHYCYTTKMIQLEENFAQLLNKET